MANYIIQRVFRNHDDGQPPIREVLGGGYGTKDNAVKAVLDYFPDDVSYRMQEHSGNKRLRMIMEGQDLFYEITEITDLHLVEEGEPWDLPEPDYKEANDGSDSKE